MSSLTDKGIGKAIRKAISDDSDVYITDAAKARGVGRLRLRARPTGQCMFYFRYSDRRGRQDSLSLGIYDPDGTAGLTLRKARERAGELSRLYQDGNYNLRAFLADRDAKERERLEQARRTREELARHRQTATLEALMKGYVAHLEKQEKESFKEVRSSFKKNVTEAFPELAATRACEITFRDISKILAKVLDRGAGRGAGKLRSFLHAAFSCGLQADSDPTMHAELHGFNLASNPVTAVPAKNFAQFNKTRERHLTVSEMRAFLKALDDEPDGIRKDVVMLLLLIGGQRIKQLLRAKPENVDMDDRIITILDKKGNRPTPRRHHLPLPDRAAAIVQRYLALRIDDKPLPYVFTTDNKVPIDGSTVAEIVTAVSAKMVANNTAREPFQLRDVRRTCETMFAAMGISKDLRSQLQSHGISGVQDRHYDKHDYLKEKKNTLEAWAARLDEIKNQEPAKDGKVTPIKSKQAVA
jgi:integrase